MPDIRIRCPKCNWEPYEDCRWMCSICNTKWNTFETGGCCPGCGKVYEDTLCPRSKGGCQQMSPHVDWYEYKHTKTKTGLKSIFFWRKDERPPVTDVDKVWIERSLVLLSELFEPAYLKSLITITPDKQYFDRDFTGTEEDAIFVFEKLTSIMDINAWEMELMFYSNSPTKFSEGITATEQAKLKGSWKSSSGQYVNKGFGSKEIWIELQTLKDPIGLIATMAHELSHYKLLGENRIEENDELLTDLTALVFGFGIFMGNSYFKFNQWTGTSHQGWQMRKSGYLPEQVIAYAMAWLAHYRSENIQWTNYLNKSIKKYFEQSYKYIGQNKDKVTWGE